MGKRCGVGLPLLVVFYYRSPSDMSSSSPTVDSPGYLTSFVVSLQKKNTDSLGFLPATAIRQYVERRQVRLTVANDDPIGYVLYFDGRNGRKPATHPDHLKIHQACVRYDARGIYWGTKTVRLVEQSAIRRGFRTVGAWVAHDIAANYFWRHLDYVPIAIRRGGARRRRLHYLWAKRLVLERSGELEPATTPATPPRLDSLKDLSPLGLPLISPRSGAQLKAVLLRAFPLPATLGGPINVD